MLALKMRNSTELDDRMESGGLIERTVNRMLRLTKERVEYGCEN